MRRRAEKRSTTSSRAARSNGGVFGPNLNGLRAYERLAVVIVETSAAGRHGRRLRLAGACVGGADVGAQHHEQLRDTGAFLQAGLADWRRGAEVLLRRFVEKCAHTTARGTLRRESRRSSKLLAGERVKGVSENGVTPVTPVTPVTATRATPVTPFSLTSYMRKTSGKSLGKRRSGVTRVAATIAGATATSTRPEPGGAGKSQRRTIETLAALAPRCAPLAAPPSSPTAWLKRSPACRSRAATGKTEVRRRLPTAPRTARSSLLPTAQRAPFCTVGARV